MKKPEKRVIYYSKTTDDFAGNDIKTKEIENTFQYIKTNPIWKAAAFLLYYLLGVPFAWFCIRIMNGTKIVNRRAIRKIKGGFFIYGNHTHWTDAILPFIITAPKRVYIIANRDAVSIKGLKTIVMMLGTIPIPGGIKLLTKFIATVEKRCIDGGCVAIYPEATTWPYYNGIRPFPSTSFTYPAKLGVPVVAMVTTFRKRRGFFSFIKTPARTVTISDPVSASPNIPMWEARDYLHDQVYNFMKENVLRNESYEYIHYEENTDISAPI